MRGSIPNTDVYSGDMLIYLRWLEILSNPPQYLELITWNDYGESHYIGPLSTRHTDDGGSKWANDMFVLALALRPK